MNHTIPITKFLQRTCLALNYSIDVNMTKTVCRHVYKQHQDLVRNSSSMTAPIATAVKRFYVECVSKQSYTTAQVGRTPPLSVERAYELIAKLKDSERMALKLALDKHHVAKLKESYEGQLAATTWRTKFGRVSKVSTLSDVDPTGAFCTLDEWLKRKAEEKTPPPSRAELTRIFFTNAVPFVAFGFLDNFIMIVAGDSIDNFMGSLICISTMATAGLGNTISDIVGIGTASYVERFCAMLGLKHPDLSPAQLEMKVCQRVANFGRVIGITIGCLLGMFPLLFLNTNKNDDSSASTDS